MSQEDELLYQRLLAEDGRPVAAGHVTTEPEARHRAASSGLRMGSLGGAATGAAAGAFVGGPIGAAIGSLLGAILFGAVAEVVHGRRYRKD